MNNGIIEMYISQISECYRAVLNDLIAAGNISAVALATMINTREGTGFSKQIFSDNEKETANTQLPHNTQEFDLDHAFRISSIALHVKYTFLLVLLCNIATFYVNSNQVLSYQDVKHLYIIIGAAVIFILLFITFSLGCIYCLMKRKIEVLEKRIFVRDLP